MINDKDKDNNSLDTQERMMQEEMEEKLNGEIPD